MRRRGYGGFVWRTEYVSDVDRHIRVNRRRTALIGCATQRDLETRKARTTRAASRWLASTSELRWRISSAGTLVARAARAARRWANLVRALRRRRRTASECGK